MGSITDEIERYIKELIEKNRKTVRISRNQLAEMFDCVPSQINYVLSTRFSTERGYIVESRRGGGGFLMITKLPISDYRDLIDLLNSIPERVSQRLGENIIQRLCDEGFLSRREAALISAAIDRDTLSVGLPDRDVIRGNIIRAVFRTILKDDSTGEV